MSATQMLWRALGDRPYPPPPPKRGAARYGPDDRCWLCGGPVASETGWPRALVPETFTNVNLAAVPTSQTVCAACAALGFAGGEAWKAYAAAHPERGLKTMHPIAWRSYSHAFGVDWHECPTRARWRSLLLDPPAPPFVCVVAVSGQKHILYRAAIAYDRETFPVQMEEERLIVRRERFAACLTAFECLYRLAYDPVADVGFSKASIVSGDYHDGQIMRAGVRAWKEAEDAFAPWRERHVGLVHLAAFVAQREETDDGELAD